MNNLKMFVEEDEKTYSVLRTGKNTWKVNWFCVGKIRRLNKTKNDVIFFQIYR